MLSFSHTLASLPFGVAAPNIVIAFIGAFLFHLFCDHLLHWNIYPHHFKKYPFGLVAIDVIGGFFVAFLIVGDKITDPFLLAAILGGNMPDILHAGWELAGKDRRSKWPHFIQRFFFFHHRIQRETLSPLKGLISQLIVVALSLLALWWV